MQSTGSEFGEDEDEEPPLSPSASGEDGDIEKRLFPPKAMLSPQLLDEGSLHKLKMMVRLQANLNSHQEDGLTPLTKALLAKDMMKAKLLLEHGANPNLAIPSGETPLYMMACEDNLAGMRLLMEHHADPNKMTLDGKTPLYGAAVHGHFACLEFLLNNGADHSIATSDEGETAVFGAASHGRSLCMDELIERGADMDKTNKNGLTPLMAAAKRTSGNYIESFLDTTGDPLRGEDLGRLSQAPGDGYEECVKMLVERHCAIAEDMDEDQTPLVWAAKTGSWQWMEIFLDKGSDPDKLAPNGDTALFWAAEGGHELCVDLLLKHKANPNLATRYGETPLFAVSRNGNLDLVKKLVEHGADPSGESNEMDNPFIPESSRHKQPESEKNTFNRFAFRESTEGTGPVAKQTPLYVAAKYGHADCVEFLMSKGADPDQFTTVRRTEDCSLLVASRDTPLIAAVSGGHAECVDILLTKASPEATSRGGKIPLKIALELQDEEIVDLLLSKGPMSNVAFFRHGSFSKHLFKSSDKSLISYLLSSSNLPWTAKQYLLERALKDSKDEREVLGFIHSSLEELSRKSIEHQTIFLLMMDFYFYIVWISTFLFSAFQAINDDYDMIGRSATAMVVLSFYFVAREILELRRSGKRYIRDIWNYVDVGAIILVMISGICFLGGRRLAGDEHPDSLAFRRIIISSGAFLTLSFVGYLKTTFLPFSNFVGGVTQILWDLFPFGIVTLIVLVSFSFMYYIRDYGEEGFASFIDAIYTVFTRFLGEFDSASNFLDLAFGVVSVMILLNVVVAIVSTSWESAVNKSLILLSRHRLELLQQVEAFLPKKGFGSFRFVSNDYDNDYFKFIETRIILPLRQYFDTDENTKGSEDEGDSSQNPLWYVVYVPLRATLVVSPWVAGTFTFGLLWPKHIRETLFSIVPDDKEPPAITNSRGRKSISSQRRSHTPGSDEEITEKLRRANPDNDAKIVVEEMKSLLRDLQKHNNNNNNQNEYHAPNQIDSRLVRMEKQIRQVQNDVQFMNNSVKEINARQSKMESMLAQLLGEQEPDAEGLRPARAVGLRAPEEETEQIRPQLADHGISYRANT